LRRALLGLGLLAGGLCGCRREPAPALPASSPSAREVPVASAPPGAQVLVGGAPRCTTPCAVRLEPGRYRVELRLAGYMPYETYLTVALDAEARLDASLVGSH
jgi:PEGA domain